MGRDPGALHTWKLDRWRVTPGSGPVLACLCAALVSASMSPLRTAEALRALIRLDLPARYTAHEAQVFLGAGRPCTHERTLASCIIRILGPSAGCDAPENKIPPTCIGEANDHHEILICMWPLLGDEGHHLPQHLVRAPHAP